MGAAHGPHGGGSLLERRRKNARRLAVTLVLVSAYMVAEVIGGILSGSLALLADAGHMLSDAAALALALFAVYMARRPATRRRSYGFYRGEILAALANGAALVAVSLFIVTEAWERFRSPVPIHGPLMLSIASGGLAVNLAALWILHEGRRTSLNVRGAWLHVVGDTLGSIGAISSGLLIWLYGWTWSDPLASVLIALLVVYSAWNLLKETVSVLMESAPGHIDVDEVHTAMVRREGVIEVHDLHVWTITSGIESLSAHVVVTDGLDRQALLAELRLVLHERFGIDHITIQIEGQGFEERSTPF